MSKVSSIIGVPHQTCLPGREGCSIAQAYNSCFAGLAPRVWPARDCFAEPVSGRAQRGPGARNHACANLPQMMHIARELCGGQISVTPNAASFAAPGPGEWLEKFDPLNENWLMADRRKLLAVARDLLNSDYAGHRLSFVQFAQAPHFNHLNALYNAFDFSAPLDFVKKAADLSDRVDIGSV
jgi:hypothetical protein